jgi:SAM-dependent methyltransferase
VLALARAALGESARLVRADMRMLPFAMCFDAVVNFFTSFGYFLDPRENERAAQEMARVLKPGGRFLVDHVNAAYIEQHLVPQSVREYNGYTIKERRWIDRERRRVNKTTVVTSATGEPETVTESVQLYTAREFRSLLGRAGLVVDNVCGDYSGGALDSARPRMVMTGYKG